MSKTRNTRNANDTNDVLNVEEKKKLFTPEVLDALLGATMEGKNPENWNELNDIVRALKTRLAERILGEELTYHLGYEKRDAGEKPSTNRRNGTSSKTLVTEEGSLTVHVPRDRDSSFQPQFIRKHQRRLDGFDEKVIALYARGMSMKDIQGHLAEIYGVDVSPELISTVTDAVVEEVRTWQTRPLESHYPIVYLDAIVVKILDSGHISNRAVYLAIGVDLDGKKDVLGLWTAKGGTGAEGAKFWLSVMTELKNRGVEDETIRYFV